MCVLYINKGLSMTRCHFDEVLDNPIFSEITFIFTESLSSVEGDEASGPA